MLLINVRNMMFFSIVFTSYLLLGTGIEADEYGWIRNISAVYYPDLLITTPVLHYTHMLPLKFVNLDNLWIIDILKIIYINIFIYMIYKYISLFHTDKFSFLLSFFIVMFYLHDGATFWFTGNYIIFAFAFMAYAYYLLEKGFLKISLFIGFIGSFVSYSSPIFASSLSLGFLLKKDFKNFFIYITPNFIYIIYYIVVTKYFAIGTDRVHIEHLNIIKQYTLQMVTYFDAVSIAMLFKTYYLIIDLPVLYYVVSLVIVLIIKKIINFNETRNRMLMITFFSMMFVGFFILSLTGGYYQMSFSLSNRVMFFTTIILVYLVVTLPYNKYIRLFVIYIFIVAMFATSLHWKEWNEYQIDKTIKILANPDVSKLTKEVVYIYGQNKSLLGNIDHLEFSMLYNTDNIKEIYNLNKSYIYRDDYLVNIETSNKTKLEDNCMYVYFLDDDKLKKVCGNDINSLIKLSSHNFRHWAQTLKDDSYVKKLIYKAMPSLNYER